MSCENYNILVLPKVLQGNLIFSTYNLMTKSFKKDSVSIPLEVHWNKVKGKPIFSDVALSGDYNDLTNKPTFNGDAVVINADWLATSGPAFIKNKPDISFLATLVDFEDLRYTVGQQIQSKVGFEDINDIYDRLDIAETQISQNALEIALKASSELINSLEDRITYNEAQLTIHSDQIATKVSEIQIDGILGRIQSVESQIIQNASDILFRATKAEVNAQGDRIEELESNLSIQANQIESKVSRTEFEEYIAGAGDNSALTQRMNNVETTLTQQASQIQLKASQASFDSLNNKVNQNEATLTVHANQISSKVSQEDFDDFISNIPIDEGLVGRVTLLETTVSQTASEISLKADKTVVDDLTGRVTDTEAQLTIQAGEIQSKVSQTVFDDFVNNLPNDEDLTDRVTLLETSLTQTASQISLKADQVTVNALTGRITDAEAQLIVQAGEISTKVSQQTFDDYVANVEDNSALTQRVVTLETQFSQTASDLALKASKSELDTLTGRVSLAESAITQNASEIELKVDQTDFNGTNLVSLINLSPEGVKISGDKIDIQGTVTFSALSSSLQNTINDKADIDYVDDQKIYIEYSTDQITWNENFQVGNIYMRQKKGSGAWSDPMRIVGMNGLSAYETAVANGFVGTEAQWLASLEGQDGTGIQIKGNVPTLTDLNNLNTSNLDPGDSYLVKANGLLYIWDGTDWSDGVQFKGDPGEDGVSSYVHIAYAQSSTGLNNFSTTHYEGATHIGFLVDNNPTDSTNPAHYNWTLVKGEQGPPGLDGIDGAQGLPGLSSYTHIAYAQSEDGTVGFSTTSSLDATHIGIYVNNSPTDSTDPSDYNWTLIKGMDGSDGIPGTPGADGQTPYLHIAYANNTSGLDFSVSDSTDKLYIGQYTDFEQNDSLDYTKYKWSKIKGEVGEQGPPGLDGLDGAHGLPGADGTSSYTHIAYAKSPSGTVGFSTTDSTGATHIGMYVDTNPNDSMSPSSYRWTQIRGADGEQGIPGAKGADGLTPFLHIAYADDEFGNGFSQSAQNKSYIGTYTDHEQTDSSNPAHYTWAKFRGEPIVSDTAPTTPYIGMVWIDSLKTPPEQKIWTGASWEVVGITSDKVQDISYLDGLINKAKTDEESIIIGGYINTKFIDVATLAVRSGPNSGTILLENGKINASMIELTKGMVVSAGGNVTHNSVHDIVQYSVGDKLKPTTNQNRGGVTYYAGRVYEAKNSGTWNPMSTYDWQEVVSAKSYSNIMTMPDGYKRGEILFQTGPGSADGRTFIDGKVYIAIRDHILGAGKGLDFELLTTKDAQDALAAANNSLKIYRGDAYNLPSNYKVKELFIPSSDFSKFKANTIYQTVANGIAFQEAHWIPLSSLEAKEAMQIASDASDLAIGANSAATSALSQVGNLQNQQISLSSALADVQEKTSGRTFIGPGVVETGVVLVGNGSTATAGLSGVVDNGVESIIMFSGAGYNNKTTAPWRVTYGGSMYAANGTVEMLANGTGKIGKGTIDAITWNSLGETTIAGLKITSNGMEKPSPGGYGDYKVIRIDTAIGKIESYEQSPKTGADDNITRRFMKYENGQGLTVYDDGNWADKRLLKLSAFRYENSNWGTWEKVFGNTVENVGQNMDIALMIDKGHIYFANVPSTGSYGGSGATHYGNYTGIAPYNINRAMRRGFVQFAPVKDMNNNIVYALVLDGSPLSADIPTIKL